MSPILRFIAGGWTFFWRQPALQRSTALLVFLPLVAIYELDPPSGLRSPEQTAVLVVLNIAAFVFLTWGIACTLTVGKRLLQAKAGRLRTSFKAVQGQARGLVVPLLLTDILRLCIAVFWGLPLVGLLFVALWLADENNLSRESFDAWYPWVWPVGFVLALLPLGYLLLTSLAPLAVAYEKLSPRQALARSRQLTWSRFGRTLAIVIVLLLLWTPGLLVETAFGIYIDENIARYAMPVVTAFFDTFALTLWLLTMTQYYKALGGATKTTDQD